MKKLNRCSWASNNLLIEYHDNEWGRIVTSEQKLFELLMLECMQAGLSWYIILKKRENYLKTFDNFDYNLCAKYSDEFLEKQRENEGIIRNKLKIYAIRKNALAFIEVQKEFETFYNYIWSFVEYKKINNENRNSSDLVGKSSLSDKISKDMKKRGFSFVGSTVIYSYLQAIGIINDHFIDCFCYEDCKKELD
ncbi:DNA-3-methyladenine glycosylase I [Gemella sp. GH3]|uniref:DNA-3-methyladenine glycosylase I n=1 Tax=unclassified Gemella TaxID=2624949 RepID=UPI0015D01F40|nr:MULTISPECIES: DNA-3-methyladenine glycosylase I [unclassified Gemella]MBF0713891.1 DNA-3-methyladenine glycosylase I [Gemella sp. GH3.1]NYS50843.1 DNA-3-methyladenine glycosylase I [Gemella sp. GH3]